MPGFLLHVGATVMCMHGGQAMFAPTNPRVLINGVPASVMSDQYLIAGCPFTIPPTPQPCLRVQWTVPSARILINGVPALLQSSMGLTLGPTQAPQGTAIVAAVQPRVGGM